MLVCRVSSKIIAPFHARVQPKAMIFHVINETVKRIFPRVAGRQKQVVVAHFITIFMGTIETSLIIKNVFQSNSSYHTSTVVVTDTRVVLCRIESCILLL